MKKLIMQIVIILILIFMMGSVEAASFKFTATSDKSTIKPGDEIEITLAVSDIDLGENGMNTLEGVLDYDRDVFEEVKKEAVTSKNNWAITYNDEDTDLNGKFLGIILGGGVKEDQSVATIKLKAKSEVEVSSTNIIIKNIATNDGTNLVEEGDKTITIKIELPKDEDNENGNENNNTTKPDDSNAITPIKPENNNSGPKILPKAGASSLYIILASIIGILAIICYIKYKNTGIK